jgi:hypothetical protein
MELWAMLSVASWMAAVGSWWRACRLERRRDAWAMRRVEREVMLAVVVDLLENMPLIVVMMLVLQEDG